jgi:hypothetical protein
MKAKSFHHKVISYGPGGYKCPCCVPHPKKRQEERRFLRRAFNRLLDDIEKDDESGIDWYMFPEFDQHNLWTMAELWYEEWLNSQGRKTWYQKLMEKKNGPT